MVSGACLKSHILKKKMAAPKFLFLKSELILCNIFPPFSWFLVYQLSLILVGWDGADAFKLMFWVFLKRCKSSTVSPSSDCVSTACCGAAEERTSLMWVKWDCPHREKSHNWTFGACLSPSVALWLKDISWCMKYKQIISDASRDASREAAGPCDNTVLLMYKRRERLILNLVNIKCIKVKAR